MLLLLSEMGRHRGHSNVYGSGDCPSIQVYYGPLKIKDKTLLVLVKDQAFKQKTKADVFG